MDIDRHRIRNSLLLLGGITLMAASAAAGPVAADPRSLFGDGYRISRIQGGITPGDDNAARLCSGFSLSERNIRAYLGKARIVSDAEIHDSFDWAPCYVRARLTQAGHAATVEIRASGIGSMTVAHGPPVKLGCAAECDEILSGTRSK